MDGGFVLAQKNFQYCHKSIAAATLVMPLSVKHPVLPAMSLVTSGIAAYVLVCRRSIFDSGLRILVIADLLT
jgi:hypothetical protein